jgi:hypothetical protein
VTYERTVLYFVTIALLASSQAVAEMAAPPAEGPGPLSKQFPCEAFVKNPDGSWTPLRDVNIRLPDGYVMTVGPAATFIPGKVALGPDVGSVIERECRH